MVHDEKKFRTLLISSCIICSMGIIFLIISIQSFWYRYKVEEDIKKQYNEFTATMEESFIATYIKDASFIAIQKPLVEAITKSEKNKTKQDSTSLLPFEYFLLQNSAFLRGYVVTSGNALVQEIAQQKNGGTKTAVEIDKELTQRVLTNNAIEVYTHTNDIVDIGVPVYNESTLIGAVVLSFSLPTTRAEYSNLITQKQTNELEKDLFNREEFIYTITVVGIAFIIISILLFSVYLHIRTGYSLFERMYKKHKEQEENDDDYMV